MTFDNELFLITETEEEDEMGDLIRTRKIKPVLCDVLSVTRSEHYEAAALGHKPSIVFVVSKWDYEGEKEVNFGGALSGDGKKVIGGTSYNVTRTFEPKLAKAFGAFETIELVCEGAVNHGHA